jgi:hypothetical protein
MLIQLFQVNVMAFFSTLISKALITSGIAIKETAILIGITAL